MQNIILRPLKKQEREDFIKRNQTSFNKAVVEKDKSFRGDIIPRQDIIKSLDGEGAQAFNVLCDGKVVGGTIVAIDEKTQRNSLDILFIDVDFHGKGIGYAVWKAIEQAFPQTKVWETHTPYFEKRNIHFYVNKCGFHIVEFFNEKHPEPNMPADPYDVCDGVDTGFFRFEKIMDGSIS